MGTQLLPATMRHLERRRLVSLNEAAAYFGCSPRTIRRMVASGLIAGYRITPRLLRVDLDELDRSAERIPSAAS
jgi:excisionase family DNA binding protein